MKLLEQIESGKLVCPVTMKRLLVDSERSVLRTSGGMEYPLLNGNIPVLLADRKLMDAYVAGSEKMTEEYGAGRKSMMTRLVELQRKLVPDYRKRSAIEGFNRVISSMPHDALCLSIGGGPQRQHPNLTNLNAGPFPNVDVVADAHQLPYADESIDAIYCEAVLEHLSQPIRAVQEMHRVLKKGGEAFVVTPFLQAYHGYPHHYQNFTLTGHRYLFNSNGFEIMEAGTCVGPVYTIFNLTSKFIRSYLPSILSLPLLIFWNLLGVILRPIDRVLNERENSHILASTTYLIARKE
jgi:SAM-dependent methyltransferase/uncharacterized protein YbaR (Trm112 family)